MARGNRSWRGTASLVSLYQIINNHQLSQFHAFEYRSTMAVYGSDLTAWSIGFYVNVLAMFFVMLRLWRRDRQMSASGGNPSFSMYRSDMFMVVAYVCLLPLSAQANTANVSPAGTRHWKLDGCLAWYLTTGVDYLSTLRLTKENRDS